MDDLVSAPVAAPWSADQHPGWCVPDSRTMQGCRLLGRGGHLSLVVVEGHPTSGELRIQLARIQGQHDEQTIVVAEATAAGHTTVLWLTIDEWHDLITTVDDLITHDHEVLTYDQLQRVPAVLGDPNDIQRWTDASGQDSTQP